MYFFYIIYSAFTDKYYYGSTQDVLLRLKLHNAGSTPSTKAGIPWTLIYSEQYENKSKALKREKEVKRMKSRKLADEVRFNLLSDDLLSRCRDKRSSQLS